MIQNLKRNWLVVSKLTWGIWRILTRALKSLKNLHFNRLLLNKVYNVWAKKSTGELFHDTGEWCKVWRKADSWFGKWQEEFGKFLPEHSKVSKLGLWWDPFIESRKCMNIKFTEELCIMTMKNDAKFEQELSCRFKIETTIWRILTRALSKISTLMGSFWPKYIMVELKKCRRSYLWWHWRLMQNWLAA